LFKVLVLSWLLQPVHRGTFKFVPPVDACHCLLLG